MEFTDLIQIPRLNGVVFTAPLQKPVEGSLCIMDHHIILSARKQSVDELCIRHDNVDSIERKTSSSVTGGTLVMKCKDLRIISLQIASSDHEFISVANSLESLASLDNPQHKYPFFYRPLFKILVDGWTEFNPEGEFTKLIQRDDWRISYLNSDYSVCPSYPKVVVVPKCIDDETIVAASKFREGGRFPVLSYRHESGAVLIRSSQPLTGPNNRRSREDEKLINCVVTSEQRGYIVDTRSLGQAQAAKARGGGYEPEMHYPKWKRVHSGIDKHQNWLDSFSKLMDACNDTSLNCDRWLSKLDSSNWLSNVNDLMNCSCLIAQFLDRDKASVLVHDAEGMDTTLIVTSLTQIILNPDCRTVKGFEALIEREWLQAGHPFAKRHQRSCYSSPSSRTKSEAPSFLLFLDCVSQIHSQFACSFEFSTTFLVWLFEHSYSSQFGTFLGNNEKERDDMALSKRTTSLWTYIDQLDVLQSILNPLYEPNSSVIWPSVAPVSMNLWNEVYLRWVIDQSMDREVWAKIAVVKSAEKELRSTTVKLRRQLADLERELQIRAGLVVDESSDSESPACQSLQNLQLT